ncbi:MAG: hypothetical protein HUU26_08215 [Gemmatimonadaceae bacterium]|nr:hypothetical protein [Gemmatimonadaceae bacterium]
MNRMLKSAVVPAMLLALAPPAPAQDARVDVTGKWQFTVTYEGGSGSPLVTLTQKGDSITGRYSSQVFGEIDLKGSVKGQEFSFGFTTAAGGDSFTMTFTGSMNGKDALRGSVDMGGMGSGTFTAVRQKDPAGAGGSAGG